MRAASQTPSVEDAASSDAWPPLATATSTAPGGWPPPAHGFGIVYDLNPRVAARLGAVQSSETPVQLVRQTFERGTMFRRTDTQETLVLHRSGVWSLHRDDWQDGGDQSDVGEAPAGWMAPSEELGELWRQRPALRRTLGWALAPEEPVSGVVQEFAGGRMLGTWYRLIHVLYRDGTWQSFADTYLAPTPEPAGDLP